MGSLNFYKFFALVLSVLFMISVSSCATLSDKQREAGRDGVYLMVHNHSFDQIGVYYSQGPRPTTWTPAINGVRAISDSDTVRIEARPQRGQLHLCIYRLGQNRVDVKRMCSSRVVGNANLVKHINIFPGALVELDVNNRLSATVGVWQMPPEEE